MRLQISIFQQLRINDSSQSVILITTITTTITTIAPSSSTISSTPCTRCEKEEEMSKGAFAAFKVREQMNNGSEQNSGSSWGSSDQKQQSSYFQNMNKVSGGKDGNPPAKYNEKMMMSIWGLYNQYSVHNLKSNTYENTQ